jgi:hypothetical protein
VSFSKFILSSILSAQFCTGVFACDLTATVVSLAGCKKQCDSSGHQDECAKANELKVEAANGRIKNIADLYHECGMEDKDEENVDTCLRDDPRGLVRAARFVWDLPLDDAVAPPVDSYDFTLECKAIPFDNWEQSPPHSGPHTLYTANAECAEGYVATGGGVRNENLSSPARSLDEEAKWRLGVSEPMQDTGTAARLWHCEVFSADPTSTEPPPFWCVAQCCKVVKKESN